MSRAHCRAEAGSSALSITRLALSILRAMVSARLVVPISVFLIAALTIFVEYVRAGGPGTAV
jgi:Na+-translocating ferredoxin:NAD+ oxidoreductase RnfE subunit